MEGVKQRYNPLLIKGPVTDNVAEESLKSEK